MTDTIMYNVPVLLLYEYVRLKDERRDGHRTRRSLPWNYDRTRHTTAPDNIMLFQFLLTFSSLFIIFNYRQWPRKPEIF